jgi:hypothetical protein
LEDRLFGSTTICRIFSSLPIAPLLLLHLPRVSTSLRPCFLLTMSSETTPIKAASSSATSSSSILDRLGTWASENKAVVYTIAGTAVVITGAGVVYYLSESRKNNKGASVSAEKRKSKKERRKEKKAAEEGNRATSTAKDEEAGNSFYAVPAIPTDSPAIAPAPAAPKVATVEAEDDVPQIDETTVDSFSQEVALVNPHCPVVPLTRGRIAALTQRN